MRALLERPSVGEPRDQPGMPAEGHNFWREAVTYHGSVTPLVMPRVLIFGMIATSISIAAWLAESYWNFRIGLEVAPHEIAGATLGLLLILRTNAGYDRWWEARRLWGGIVNQSRNLVISGLAYGPSDPRWQQDLVVWAAVFPYVSRASLRGEPLPAEVVALLGPLKSRSLSTADHPPSAVALRLAELLRDACESLGMDQFAFLQIDRERTALIDHIGACERIQKSPLPRICAIKIRRFIVMFLLTLPFALLHRVEISGLVPIVTMLVAYPLLALDQIGVELQNPFATRNLSHLPLESISVTIARNLRELLKERQSQMVDAG